MAATSHALVRHRWSCYRQRPLVLRILVSKDVRIFMERPHYWGYLFVLLVSIGLTVLTGIYRYRRAEADSDRWTTNTAVSIKALKRSPSLVGPGITQTFPPNPLAALVHGAEDLITAPFVTRNWSKQEMAYINERGPLASLIVNLDLAMLIFLLGPLLVMYLSHAALRDELVMRTAQSNLLFNVDVRTLVIAKYIAAIACTLGPVLAFSLAALGGLSLFVHLSGEQWIRGGLIAVVEIVFLWFWISFVFAIQLLSRSPKTIIAFAVLVWLGLVLIVPAMVSAIRDARHPLSQELYFKNLARVYADTRDHYVAYRSNRLLPTMSTEDFRFFVGVMDAAEQQGVHRLEYHELATHFQDLSRRFTLGHLSPFYLGVLVVTELAGTGPGDYLNFREHMADYRNQYSDFVWGIAFSSWIDEATKPSEEFLRAGLEFRPRRLDLESVLRRTRLPVVSLLTLNLIMALIVLLGIPKIIPRRMLVLMD